MRRILIYTIFSLSAISAHATDRICYSAAKHVAQMGVFNQGVSLAAMPRNDRHQLALTASALIYKLADLDIAASGAQFIAAFTDFRNSVPAGYTVDTNFSNRQSGLKYMILVPEVPTEPFIFAFAGTQTAIDWLSDLALGREQLSEVEALIYNFTNCEYAGPDGSPFASHNWIITGHSLGGGLAEAFAYKAQRSRLLRGLAPGPIELVTFNAFGALDLVENSSADAQIVTSTLSTYNYFVTGDEISRIGTHIGQSYELAMPRAGILQAVKRHLIGTVQSAAATNGFDTAKPVSPPRAGLLNALKGEAAFFNFLVDNQSDNVVTQLTHLNMIEDAINIVAARRAALPYDHDLMNYVQKVAMAYLQREESRPQVAGRREVVARIKHILDRSAALQH